jgi:hypothetical protein
MSTDGGPSPPPLPPPPLPPPQQRSGCAEALLLVIGIILLLPGLCALLIALGTPGHLDPLVLLGLLAGGLGLALLWFSDRRGRS